MEEFLIYNLTTIEGWLGNLMNKPFLWRAKFCLLKLAQREEHVQKVVESYHTAVTTDAASFMKNKKLGTTFNKK